MDQNEKETVRKMKTKFCKEICKKCYEEGDRKWNYYYELEWRDGWVWCRVERRWSPMYTEEMPDRCLYQLEHTVMGNKSK